jgi:iron complex outermembrane receptor protein
MSKNLLLLILFIPFISFAQKVNVSGNIKSSSETLLGVSVVEKGTANGTTTDIDGNYSIKVDQNSILILSYLGYKTQEVSVKGKTRIDINLTEDESELDEVVIKGFGGVVGQARRRAESVQSIPESVVTFTANAI